MPRCETCMAMQSSADVRKLPGRDAYRCKDKWACMLAESNRDPWTATFTITFPALNEREARDIIGSLPKQMKPLPVEIIGLVKDERPTQDLSRKPAEDPTRDLTEWFASQLP